MHIRHYVISCNYSRSPINCTAKYIIIMTSSNGGSSSKCNHRHLVSRLFVHIILPSSNQHRVSIPIKQKKSIHWNPNDPPRRSQARVMPGLLQPRHRESSHYIKVTSADTAVTSTIVVTAIGDRNAALLMSALVILKLIVS